MPVMIIGIVCIEIEFISFAFIKVIFKCVSVAKLSIAVSVAVPVQVFNHFEINNEIIAVKHKIFCIAFIDMIAVLILEGNVGAVLFGIACINIQLFVFRIEGKCCIC